MDKNMNEEDKMKQEALEAMMIAVPDSERCADTLRDDLAKFTLTGFCKDAGILLAMDLQSREPDTMSKIPGGLGMTVMLFTTMEVPQEDIVCMLCAKHLALRSLRNGDEDLIGAYAEVEHASQLIKTAIKK